ncbi:phytanoyl-CoA dioxygenase family protein [bacterium]|uniref:Phytanoyl-CoA dioxygenase n=1 Tax=Rubinisphaera brasiliensis (strain ATCC 49424 / DSM 5305 / JCM 21570 / IAM 15109 / NBRC 103401 / IFAM 1448) TaxID=756272 RepID=F0SIJ6_RUBBR|nr:MULTISPECIES: phytanoyl-CoA dioxygenase family protein [Rubinisphaera]ADY59624.1 Phytanoyl-CoA dioxygenase [Rubinisphaera brasiliensis DSM 5305]MBR9801225.1 phytanoyl-CoA dioxygenase family protein [bacterium]
MAAPNYKIVPDQSELDAIQRDLSFYPSQTTDPAVLTPDQIEFFNREGYVRPVSVFTRDEVNDIRSYFDDLLEKVIAAGGDSYSISSAHLKYGRVWDILHHPKIVAAVADLLGHNIIGWGSHFFCKMPHDGKQVAWHQDSSYWPLSPSKAVTVWLAIDDVDGENAPMRFIAGSHHKGHLTYRPSSSEEHNVLSQTIEDPEQYGEIVENWLEAGQVSLHSDLLLHGSEANESDRRRCALTLRYAAADVRAHLEWNQKGVWVQGEDPTGHWANNPRPEQD